MAIQPIDLSAMYNNMRMAQNVANQQQGAKAAEASQQQNAIQQSMEAASKVHVISGENSQASMVKDNGGGTSGAWGMQHGKRDQKDEENQEEPSQQNGIRESYLGQHIDITR